MEAAACAKPATEYTYVRREPEKTALYRVMQEHLLTFEQQWTDQADGRTLPSFVTDELHDFLGCGVLARGLAQLFCPTCHERYVVGWSCKGRGFCPSCGGRRMNAGALTLVDHVLPDVPLRQFVITLPFPLRFPLAFDGKLLGQVLRIFIDTVASNYRKRLADRGIAGGQYGAVTVIQRANSDLRCNPHVHAILRPLAQPTSASPSVSCSIPTPIRWPRATYVGSTPGSIFTLLPRSPPTTGKAAWPCASTPCVRPWPTTG
jgi:hypothetical protein